MSSSNSSSFHHRSTLKQKNKPFKGTTKAKSANARGKIDKKTLISAHGLLASLNKVDRRNQNKLKQTLKRGILEDQKKIFTGPTGVPRNIAIIPLTPHASVEEFLAGLGLDSNGSMYVESFKQNLRFFTPDRNNLFSLIDTASAVDTILFLVSAQDPSIDNLGVDLLEVLRAQGLCTTIACIQSLDTIKASRQHSLRLEWLNSLTFHLAATLHPRLFSSDHFESKREQAEMLRILCQLPIYEGISWRDPHPYLLAESAELTTNQTTAEPILRITGRVRGSRAFSANQLVHLPGIGDFQLDQISLLGLHRRGGQMEVDSNIIQRSDPALQEALFDPSVVSHYENEDMNNDAQGENEAEREKHLIRVPKGTSSYQARMIHEAGLDESSAGESEDDSDNEITNEKDSMVLEASDAEDAVSDDEELVDINAEEEDSRRDLEREEKEGEIALNDYTAMKNRTQDEPLSKTFPDAVESPTDQSARQRFAKYRGVESLRTSEWDREADQVPSCMSHIFQFSNFKLSMKKALTVDLESINSNISPFCPGSHIQMDISLKNVQNGSHVANSLLSLVNGFKVTSTALTVYGLLSHEQKYSLMNYSIQPRLNGVDCQIRSKEPVLMISGFRRLEVSPIYSDASRGHHLHSMHRILPTDSSCTASIFAPISYPPCPILLFRPRVDNGGAVSLYASGSLESVNPNRIILKKITLIGYPFKIHRRMCTVRFMFFNPADVNWFRPVELITSRQFRRGHIKESLGTHGYMKCIFDKQVQQNEQIAMHLYKRVFPKWSTRVCSVQSLALENDRVQENNNTGTGDSSTMMMTN